MKLAFVFQLGIFALVLSSFVAAAVDCISGPNNGDSITQAQYIISCSSPTGAHPGDPARCEREFAGRCVGNGFQYKCEDNKAFNLKCNFIRESPTYNNRCVTSRSEVDCEAKTCMIVPSSSKALCINVLCSSDAECKPYCDGNKIRQDVCRLDYVDAACSPQTPTKMSCLPRVILECESPPPIADCSPGTCDTDVYGSLGCTLPNPSPPSGISCTKSYTSGGSTSDSCVGQAGAGYSVECVYPPSACVTSADTTTCYGSCVFTRVSGLSGGVPIESSQFSQYLSLVLIALLVIAGYSVSKK